MYKKVVAALAMIFAMLFVSIGAFAASPAVQEVEALISQIGTVTRENRSAVESAVNAYNQLDEASKAAVSNYAVLAEAQQVLGIKDALAKLGVEYDKVQNSAAMRSPYSDKNEESGTCVFAPMLCIYEEYDFPVLFTLFEYIGQEHLGVDSIVVRAGDYKYQYGIKDFVKLGSEEQKIKNRTVAVEYGMRVATDYDYNMFMDILSSIESIVRFSRLYHGEFACQDYTITNEDRQAITDVINAYNLMCSVSPEVMRKALA